MNLDETFQSTSNRMVMRYKADVDLPFNSLAVYYWHGKDFSTCRPVNFRIGYFRANLSDFID